MWPLKDRHYRGSPKPGLAWGSNGFEPVYTHSSSGCGLLGIFLAVTAVGLILTAAFYALFGLGVPKGAEYIESKQIASCDKECKWECSKMVDAPEDCMQTCIDACSSRRTIIPKD